MVPVCGICTFHNACLVDGELEAFFADLYMRFLSEVDATEEEVELAGRAGDSRENGKLVAGIVFGVHGGGCVSNSKAEVVRAEEQGMVKSGIAKPNTASISFRIDYRWIRTP